MKKKQDEGKKYYDFIIKNAIALFKLRPIKKIISNSYKGLFVDEYQDCTKNQHELIKLLSELLPTRILGDPFQGIFGFNGEELIDLEIIKASKEFVKEELYEPQRWLNGNNAKLGEDLKSIREILKNKKNIDLEIFSSIEINSMNKSDQFLEYKIKNEFGEKISNPLNKKIWDLKKENSILILYPNNDKNKTTAPRENCIKLFGGDFKLLEAIDDKFFYKFATLLDNSTSENIKKDIMTILSKCYTKKGIDYWFNNTNLKPEELASLEPIVVNLKLLESSKNYKILNETFFLLHHLPNMKCIRKEIILSIISALQTAYSENCAVYEAMTIRRNTIRRVGRKVIGKSVGTTLLTKGLEFETVAIMNAHEFNCPKHLYVAMTRASKRLILFTKDLILKPYK